ncbi:MAG: hypothetical protein LBS94_00270 [Prevotellaceae bacterium]|jgi:hypothetical protein|nr:hypothetical protein [Prevotellaceae bacterium]
MEQMNVCDIKKLYPNEWILLGNPDIDVFNQRILSGRLLYHSPDKKEVCYLGKPLMEGYEETALFYTKTFERRRRTIGLLARVKNEVPL